ncbi:LOW QUALITY PROTEIN: leucine zipper protein 1-like [Sinocyclocheilus grahami]|uniref:LOW QUALITY PROTEIN: leucine zipper protein 1-like n=1 Tax=Sinocyclocheilus grahami TaxID=75366 RepID=UPI0007ACDAA3|nr:PREDICTED: LOW QUALITY PROTEIN: leucine zipper protein 1-like [Sinocyclocheilus grahami]
MTDTTNRHLRHKLQNLGRRLDELEEARGKLQKAEDELLDIQDKIIQAEGSNSSLLTDVETMRKRLLKIEGKDEEVRKAEDLCRKVREKLDQEEKLTKDLKVEIERLQRRMTELEKLEEAFGKSKSDCRQLCISLNEEKNLTKKLAAELDALEARVKEVDTSEARLGRAEKSLTAEMEKLKGLTQTFVTERKRFLERQREDEKFILKLTEKLELQKSKLGPADYSRFDSRDLRIEDEFSAGLTSKLARKKSFDYLKHADDLDLRNESENETFYPNDPSSSRTSSRSSSLSSEPPSKERHTSTSNIVIGPSSEHRGSISIPYEISIPKSEITLRQGETDADFSEPHSYLETAPVEAALLSQSSFSLQSSEASDLNNDIESGFESSSSGTTVTNWKSHHNHHSYDDSLPEMRNVTVRSTWRSRGAASVDESARALRQDGSEDECESASTWRAYRATTVLDTPSNSSTVAKCGSKPSPVEVYMRRINNAAPSVHDLRRQNKKTPSPERAIAHEPVSAQQLQPRGRKHPMASTDFLLFDHIQ